MPIIVLGIIALGAGLLWVFYMTGGGRGRVSFFEDRSAPVKPRHYEKSEDGKVVYLFNRRSEEGQGEEQSRRPSESDEDEPGDGDPEDGGSGEDDGAGEGDIGGGGPGEGDLEDGGHGNDSGGDGNKMGDDS